MLVCNNFFDYAKVFLALLSLTAGGCSTRLEVSRLDATASAMPVTGVVYYLPVGTFDIQLTRELVDCRTTDLDLEVTAKTTVKYGPDFERPMLIDYEDLNTWFKKSSLRATLNEDGTLKGLKSELTDKTGAVIANIGKSAVNVAKIAVNALAPGGLPEVDQPPLCNKTTNDAIKRSRELKAAIATKEASLTTLPAERQAVERKEIDKLREALAPLEDFLQISSSHPPLKPIFGTEATPSKCATGVGVWAEFLEPPDAKDFVKWTNPDSQYRKKARDNAGVYARAVPLFNATLVAAAARPLEAIPPGGQSPFYYRQPAPVELTLSSIDPNNRTKCVDFARSTFPLPQAGIVVFLPLENGAFDTNTIEASFHPSGALAMFDYLTESQAEAASGTLVAITDSASQMATEARSAEILSLQTQVQELELRQKLRTLQQQENAR